ncbi:hypothetical protein [Metabacillus fastidiosus]|uniref:DUF1292 domain-containing protein n=1 Tax=Metabacillus fastidiosus TaxID=1458 RepID=A0ABU6NT37_9BACI|nr:hypothetical protein [Metabacillus fastidiosus]MED4400311.1 hypothetical protein [Metabacillus fastidiosus]
MPQSAKIPIEMILVNSDGKELEDVALDSILEVDGLRYAALFVAEEMTFAQMVIDKDGITHIHDIKNDDEFKKVQSIYNARI